VLGRPVRPSGPPIVLVECGGITRTARDTLARRCRKVAANRGGRLSSVGGQKRLEDLNYDGTKSRGLPSAACHGNGDDIPYGCAARESSIDY
jgi:hypothetical protein